MANALTSLHKETMLIEKSHMERYSISLVFGEIEIKISLRYHCISE